MQGSTTSGMSDQASLTINFKKPFSNTNFKIFITMKNGVEGNYSNGINTKSYTVNSFVLVNRSGSGTSYFNWHAEGYVS